MTLPGRHGPDGTMLDHRTGRVAIWEDNFVVPERFRRRYRAGDLPLAPRATFGELQDSFRFSQQKGKASKSWSTGAQTRRSAKTAALDSSVIRPARTTTLEPVPY